MLLELCMTTEELEEELVKATGGGVVEDKYEFLSNYMKLLGTHTFGDGAVGERYFILKESFIRGDWRAINGEYQ